MAPTPSESHGKAAQIEAILDALRKRLAKGEPCDDADVVKCHPELMPELAQEIAKWRHVVEVARLADSLTDPSQNPPMKADAAMPFVTNDSGMVIEKIRGISRDVDDNASSPVAGFRVSRPLVESARSAVYDAVQVATQRRVAVKVLHGSLGESARARFDHDTQTLAQLNHPHIVAVTDQGDTAHHEFYFVTPYVEGTTLDSWVDRHHSARTSSTGAHAAKSDAQAIRLFCQICAPVNAAHQRGVFHGNLRPSNIRLDFHDNPFILDFGLPPVSPQTRHPMPLAWAPPEQLSGASTIDKQIDARSDVYSLGAILYQMITGRPPFEPTDDAPKLLAAINSMQLAPPSKILASGDQTRVDAFPGAHAIDAIVLKAMHKDPGQRYASAGDLARDVRNNLTASAPPENLAPVQAPSKPGRAALVAVAVLILLAIAAFCYWRFSATRPGEASPPATSSSPHRGDVM